MRPRPARLTDLRIGITLGVALAAVLAAIAHAGATANTVTFDDVAAALNVRFIYQHSPTSNKYLIETMGGGVALFDYDNDGRLDIFFTNGAKLSDPMPPGARPDKNDSRYWNRLFHQNKDGTFTDVTGKAGLSGNPEGGFSMGVAVGDYDNDGFEDLLVTSYEGNILYRNNGDGTFTNVTARSGVGGAGWTVSAGFFDYNNDGRLDIFVTRYLEWTFENNRYCGDRIPGYRAYCHPNNFPAVSNFLYKNNGDGKFTDVSKASGIAKEKGKSLGVAFGDYDNDGWPDIFVANDSSPCFLFHNNRNGTFSEVGLITGTSLNQDGGTFAGMGTDFADYDNDGWPDLIVTDLSNEQYVLFRNTGKGLFLDESLGSRIGPESRLYSGWGVKFFDYDNDGWKDLFVAQSHVLDNIGITAGHLKYEQPPLLLHNVRGKFARAGSGDVFQQPRVSRGAAFGDIDNDGDIDIVVANLGQNVSVLRNNMGSQNNWLGLRLQGTRSNRDGIGARIEVTSSSGAKQFYTVNTSSSYLSASDRRIIAGLGTDSVKSVVIRWPSGVVQRLAAPGINRMLNVEEPSR
jgi:enediyne biosynthesis protein E4